jgi:hypothetical protein
VTTTKELLDLAAKIDHDQYCGCSTMCLEEYPEGSPGDCPLGALLKTANRIRDTEIKGQSNGS